MPKSTHSLAAYIPVLHAGYKQFLLQHPEAERLYIFGSDLLKTQDYLRKELRALPPEDIAPAIKSLQLVPEVIVLDESRVAQLNTAETELILPDEDVSHGIAEKYLGNATVTFAPLFLRWDRQNVQGLNADTADITVSSDPEDVKLMHAATDAANASPDIWRRVGAVLQTETETRTASNQPLTTQNTPWAEGDPRGVFNRGVGIEMSTFMHAEARLLADALHDGLRVKNAKLYVTTFPCPACAMLIARSGITSVYFAEGYAVLDGLRVLQDAGITVSLVPIDTGLDSDPTAIAYPEK